MFMKKFMPIAAMLLFIVACNSNTPETTAEATTVAAAETAAPAKHEYATKPWYSSDFEIGDYKNGDVVVALWKQFDDNNLDAGLNYFADTVSMSFADGFQYTGTRDSLMKIVKGMRSGFSAFRSSIAAIVPLRSIDKDESWVCIWGTEYTTMKNKVDSAEIQENWRFDKNGKIAFMHSYARKTHK
jgi:hypothetical protein